MARFHRASAVLDGGVTVRTLELGLEWTKPRHVAKTRCIWTVSVFGNLLDPGIGHGARQAHSGRACITCLAWAQPDNFSRYTTGGRAVSKGSSTAGR